MVIFFMFSGLSFRVRPRMETSNWETSSKIQIYVSQMSNEYDNKN